MRDIGERTAAETILAACDLPGPTYRHAALQLHGEEVARAYLALMDEVTALQAKLAEAEDHHMQDIRERACLRSRTTELQKALWAAERRACNQRYENSLLLGQKAEAVAKLRIAEYRAEAAEARVREYRGILLRIASHVTPMRDANNEQQIANDIGETMGKIEELDDIVNSRVCDLECEAAQAQEQVAKLQAKLAAVRDAWAKVAGFATCNSAQGEYSVTIKYRSLTQAQDAYSALIDITKAVQVIAEAVKE